MSSIDPEGKTIWITGASSGIGRKSAMKFAERGANLVLSARREEKLEELAQECSDVRTTVIPLDVTNRDKNYEAVEKIEDEHGQLDMAFFNAGVYADMPEPIDPDAIEKDFNVNLMGMVYGIHAALPLLRESSVGQIIAMSSASAYGPLPRASSYGASKAAVKYMIEAFRFEWQQKEVDVGLSVVCPGFVKTPMTAQNEFPMPFLMEVEDAAEIVVNGSLNRKNEISFPWQLVLILKFANKLPGFLYNPLISMATGMA
jgi:short-subunit dehydrogenase